MRPGLQQAGATAPEAGEAGQAPGLPLQVALDLQRLSGLVCRRPLTRAQLDVEQRIARDAYAMPPSNLPYRCHSPCGTGKAILVQQAISPVGPVMQFSS